eukprot:2865625-Amphidinium_carterae.1
MEQVGFEWGMHPLSASHVLEVKNHVHDRGARGIVAASVVRRSLCAAGCMLLTRAFPPNVFR